MTFLICQKYSSFLCFILFTPTFFNIKFVWYGYICSFFVCVSIFEGFFCIIYIQRHLYVSRLFCYVPGCSFAGHRPAMFWLYSYERKKNVDKEITEALPQRATNWPWDGGPSVGKHWTKPSPVSCLVRVLQARPPPPPSLTFWIFIQEFVEGWCRDVYLLSASLLFKLRIYFCLRNMSRDNCYEGRF